jgi:hypothetical protein
MFNCITAHQAQARALSSLIRSGDVDAASKFYDDRCESRLWGAINGGIIRGACAVWGVNPADFGVEPPAECPPELWPLRAAFVCEPLPGNPTREDLQAAAMSADRHFPAEPCWTWHLEAIRWRMQNPVGEMDLGAIHTATLLMLAIFERRGV